MLVLSLILSSAFAMLVHELGHLVAARTLGIACSELAVGLGRELFGFKVGSFRVTLRPILLGSFVMLDGSALKNTSTSRQLYVHLAGIVFNLFFGFVAYGTTFGWINLLLAAGNLLPLYQHDGWKCGVVILRKLMNRTSPPIEWAFTFSGGFLSLVVGWAVVRMFV